MQVSGVQNSQFTVLNNQHQNDVQFLEDTIAKLKKEASGTPGNSRMMDKLEFDQKALAYLQSNPGATLGDAYVSTVVEDFKNSPAYELLRAEEPHKAEQALQELTQKAQAVAQNPTELKAAFEYHFQPDWS